jgi:undecaprenyl-diphosphatase
MAPFLPVRQRPGTSEPGAILRGADVPATGASFPSGHVILVAAVATVLANDIPVGWAWLPHAIVLVVMLGRVYVGAHNPLDVTAGLGTGLLVGALLDLFLR